MQRFAQVSGRAWRGAAVIGLAVIVLAVVAFAQLGIRPAWPASGRSARLPAAHDRWELLLASFGDANHGAVVMAETSLVRDTYVTADAGRTWQARSVGVSTPTFLDRHRAIAVDAGPQARLESTSDAGRTWRPLSTPVRVPALSLQLNHATGGPTFLDPADGWWLDAPPAIRPGPATLWRTRDGGRTWRTLTASGLPAGMQLGQPAFVDPLRGAVLLGALSPTWPWSMSTLDGGETWQPSALPAPPAGDLTLAGQVSQATQLLARNGRLVLFLTLVQASDGLAQWSSVSEDGGRTWTPWSKEPDTVMFPLAAPLFDDAGRLLLADDQLLWASSDYGRTWQSQALHLPGGGRALALVSAPAGALFVAALRAGGPGDYYLTLLRSLDGSGRWTGVHLPHEAVR